MAIKKSELYSSLWKSCDELRGGMDASQYKDYVLVLLFVKYVSDKYAGDPNSLIEVPEGGSFADMVALKGDKEIGDKINQIIARLAEANNLTGVIDVADFNDQEKLGKGKEMVDRLSNLVSIFNSPGLDFRSNRAQGDDILGDAYEYLMRHFATESGKSKGQFYTPAEVSRIMAQVIGLAGASPERTALWVPSIRTVMGGVLVDAGSHVFMADTQTPQSHQAWLAALQQIEDLAPARVIPGHYADGAAQDLDAVDFTAGYIRAFDEESAKAKDSTALIAAMQQRYPGLQGEASLQLSAKVAKGEMPWK